MISNAMKQHQTTRKVKISLFPLSYIYFAIHANSVLGCIYYQVFHVYRCFLSSSSIISIILVSRIAKPLQDETDNIVLKNWIKSTLLIIINTFQVLIILSNSHGVLQLHYSRTICIKFAPEPE